MKNLKRVLSLGLASIMLVGMMAVGASAANTTDFTDADEIQNVEAVTTMAALNVIAGKDNGSFDPTGLVTRGEMAKMITIIMNGGEEPVLAVNAANPMFKDIGGHWAQKYIEYCATNGIIAGRGDGKFDPNDNVTGTEAAKMALVALNYNADVFKLANDKDWMLNVNSIANNPDNKLYTNLSKVNPSDPLTRDQAAQLLYNALDAKMMAVSYDITNNGTIGTTYRVSDTTLMEEKYDTIKAEGIIIANEIVDLDGTTPADEGQATLELTDAMTGKDGRQIAAKGSPIDLNVDVELETLGHAVTVYVRENKKTKGTYDVVGGVVISSANIEATDFTGKTDFDKISKAVKKDTNTKYFVNYEEATNEAAAKAAVKPGSIVTILSNDSDKKAEYVFVVNYIFDQVSTTSTSKETIRFKSENTATKYEDIIGDYENLAKDDYVLTTKVQVTGESTYKIFIEEPTTLEGEMNAYKNNSDGDIISLTVEGEKYDVSWALNKSDLTDATDSKGYLDDEATFYMDANGLIVAVSNAVEEASEYAISWGGAGGNVIDTGRIKMTLADGTTKIYNISENSNWVINTNNNGKEFKWNGSASSANASLTPSAVGVLVTYSFDDEGDIKISFPETDDVDSTQTKNGITFTNGKTLVTVGQRSNTAGVDYSLKTTGRTSYQSNSSTPFFYVTINADKTVKKVEIDTGYSNAKSVAGVKGTAQVATKGEKAQAVSFVDFVLAEGSTTDLSQHLYVVSVDRTYTNYVTATVYLAGQEETTVVQLERDTDIEEDAENNDLEDAYADKMFLYTINSKGRYELVQLNDSDSGLTPNKDYFVDKVIGKTSDISIEIGINTGDTDEYFIEEDSVIIGYDEDNEVYANLAGSVEGGSIVTMLVDTKTEKVLMAVTKACPHDDLTEHAANAATCAATGNVKYWTCDECGKIFGADETGNAADTTEELTMDDVTTAKTDHNWTAWADGSGEDAGKHVRTCQTSGCNEKQTHAPGWANDAASGTECSVTGCEVKKS